MSKMKDFFIRKCQEYRTFGETELSPEMMLSEQEYIRNKEIREFQQKKGKDNQEYTNPDNQGRCYVNGIYHYDDHPPLFI